jgi:anti-sigma28 factor (negative regulator of flagellin synthesis)
MKITNTNIQTVTTGVGGTGASGGTDANQSTAGPGAKGDSVKLSNASELVSLAKSAALASRDAKLSNISAMVRSGQYNADTASVSRAVVEGHIQ